MKQQLVAGRNPVLELLQSDREVEKVLLSRNASGEGIQQIKALCREREIACQLVPEVKLNSLTRANHQGVLAFTALISYQQVQEIVDFVYAKGEDPLLLILDNLTDVRNLGAIARTALGLGVHALIVPKSESAAINDIAVKISAGALLQLPVCRVTNLAATVKDLKHNGIFIAALDGRSDNYVRDINARQPLAIIAGSEDEGVSLPLLRLCDKLVKLPMNAELESYNVSVASAMALYEVYTQRHPAL